jgi:Uma2 family endonuclease
LDFAIQVAHNGLAADQRSTMLVSAMATVFPTVAELQDQLGGIPPARICLEPQPGTATEDDLLEAMTRRDGIYELVDGVLVKKPPGFYEAIIALEIGRLLGNFVEQHDLGKVAGADGMLKILPPQVRYPDVAFVSWDRLAGHNLRKERVPHLAPDLAIEVLSESNTRREMEQKVQEYFAGGVRLVWIIDPGAETAVEYTAADQAVDIETGGTLSGRDVPPGFVLNLRDLFDRSSSSRNDPSA